MNPASAQHAALRLLLEDVDPLLQRAEEAAQTLAKVREELDADLATLGQLVQQSLDAQPLMLEAGRKLSASASRIEAAMQGSVLAPTRTRAAGTRFPLWGACAISGALSAVIVGGIVWIGMRDMSEQARVGRALMSVWPSVDSGTRTKVVDQLGKP